MENLTEGRVEKKVLYFMFPLLVGNVLQQMYSTVDAIIVGRVVGSEGLAAIGASNPIQMFLVAILIGLGSGAEIMIATRIGQGNKELVKKTTDSLLTTVLVISLILTIFGILFSKALLEWIGTPEEVLNQAAVYLRIYFTGLLGVAGYSTLSGMIRSTGNSKVPLILLIIASATNIVLDIVFVFFFHMGVMGAALATVLSQTISFLLCLFYINMNKNMAGYHIRHLDFDWNTVKLGLKCGVPFSIEQGAMSAGMILLQVCINSLGVNIMTAYTIGFRIDSFANIPITGMGQALCIFTSQNLGGKKLIRAKEGKRFCLGFSLGFSLFLLAVLWIFGKNLVGLFTVEPAIIEMSYEYIKILSAGYFAASYFVLLTGYIRGTGNTVVPMLITLCGYWFARLPLACLLKESHGYMGIWLAIPLGWLVSAIITYFYCHSKKFNKELKDCRVIGS